MTKDRGDQIKLKRLGPGLYETLDGEWQIERGDIETAWPGQWVIWSKRRSHVTSDPMPTLSAARRSLAADARARRTKEQI